MVTETKILKSIRWSALGAFFKIGVQFGSLVVLARFLSPRDLGLGAMVAAVVFWLNVFVEAFAEALVQREKLRPSHLYTVFWTSSTVGVVLLGLSFLTAPHLANWLQEPELETLLPTACIVLLLSGPHGTLVAQLRRDFRFKEVALGTSAGRLGGSVVAIAMAINGYGVWSLIGQRIATFAFAILAFFLLSRWRPRLAFSWLRLRQLGTFAVADLTAEVVGVGANQVFHLLIGQVFGSVALGLFSLACRITANLSTVIETVSRQISMSVFSRQQSDHLSLRNAVYSATTICSILATPVFFGLIACAPEFVAAFFGDQWIDAVPLVRLVSLGCAVYFLQVSLDTVLDALGRPLWHLAATTGEFVVQLVCIFAAGALGVLTAGVAALSARVVALPITFLAVRRHLGLEGRKMVAASAAPLIAATMMLLVVSLVKRPLASQSPWAILAFCVPTGAIVYVATLRICAPAIFRRFRDLARGRAKKEKDAAHNGEAEDDGEQ